MPLSHALQKKLDNAASFTIDLQLPRPLHSPQIIRRPKNMMLSTTQYGQYYTSASSLTINNKNKQRDSNRYSKDLLNSNKSIFINWCGCEKCDNTSTYTSKCIAFLIVGNSNR